MTLFLVETRNCKKNIYVVYKTFAGKSGVILYVLTEIAAKRRKPLGEIDKVCSKCDDFCESSESYIMTALLLLPNLGDVYEK